MVLAIFAPEIIAAGIGLLGIILKNNFLIIGGALIFLFSISQFIEIPFFVWIIVAAIGFFMIKGGGKKR